MKNNFKNFLIGFLIGASILIPGLSGGTTAIILGVYFIIFDSVYNIKNNFCYLLVLFAGVICGIILISVPLNYLLDHYYFEFSYFILGIIFGTTVIFKSELKNFNACKAMYIVIGILSIFLFKKVSTILSATGISFLNFIFVGVLSAAALILPGISFSNALIAFGYYDKLILALSSCDIRFLLELSASVLLGVILLSKLLVGLYKKNPLKINLIILGMILGSVFDVFDRLPVGLEFISSSLFFVSGLFTVSFMGLFKESAD